MRKIFPWLLIVLMIAPVYAQDDMPDVGVLQITDAVSDGYVLYSPIPSNIAYLIDNTGNVVHQWEAELPIFSLYLLENGDLLASVMGERGDFPAGTTGAVHRYDRDGNLLWAYDFEQDGAQIHHDIEMLPDGNILMSMWETIAPEDFASFGINPELVPQDGSSLFFDSIIEVDPATNEIVWQWRMLDHSVQDYDSSLSNFGIPANNPHLIDINYSHNRIDVADRSHINGISYHPELDQIMVSAHFQSEIWIIDRATGELVYRWGNPQAYGRGSSQDRILFNQHNPDWLDDGNILIFNNGSDNLRRYSTVVEMTPPLNEDDTYPLETDAAYAPDSIVWEYRADPQESFFSRSVSGAQRLSNGNTFITDGANGRLFEINADGEIVWEYLNPLWLNVDSATATSIFRATRYAPDYAAFDGQALTPQGQIPFEIFERSNNN